jgi:hypothetical protein
VQRDGQLDRAETAGEVATGRGPDIDQVLAELAGDSLQLVPAERPERAGIVDRG